MRQSQSKCAVTLLVVHGSFSFTLLNSPARFIISCSSVYSRLSFVSLAACSSLCCRTASVTLSNLIMSAAVTLTVMTTYKQTLRFSLFMFALPDFLPSSVYCPRTGLTCMNYSYMGFFFFYIALSSQQNNC